MVRRRIVCEYKNGNRITTPWYHPLDERLRQFFARTDEMVWIRVEREDTDANQ